jgi:integrase
MPPFKRACKRAGLVGVRFHDLRHTAASYLAQAGANTFRVAQFLGHRDLSTVARYAHLSEDDSFKSAKLIASKVSNC